MNATPYNFQYSLGYLAVVSARLFAANTNRQLAAAGLELTAEQWAMLQILLNEDGRSQEELLGFTRYEKSSLSRLLDGLEKKELIRREKSPTDGRRKNVFITEKGAEQGRTGTRLALEMLQSLYKDIDAKDLDTCRSVLARIQGGLLRVLRAEEI